MMSGDHLNYNIIEIGQNTDWGSEDLRRLVVTQNPVRNHRITVVWKTQKLLCQYYMDAPHEP